MRRVCYAGTYERDYPRNRLIVRAMRDVDVRVEEVHVPVWELQRHKGGLPGLAMAGLVIRLAAAYPRLIPDAALRLLRCDVLMIGYIGQLDSIILGQVAKLMGRPVVFNPMISLTDTLVEDRRRFQAGGIVARVLHWIDRISLARADLLLVDTEENAAFFAEEYGVDRRRLAVVQVGAEEELFHPGLDKPCAHVNLDVLFVGKFIPLHGIETILKSAALLQERGIPATFELVGTGQEYNNARELARRLRLGNVIWTDWISFDELGKRVREADVVLGIFDDGPKAARVIPNKVHQALACGTAVITRESPAMKRFLSHGESAMLVPPADAVALAHAIEELADPATRQRVGRAGYESWQTWGSRQSLASQVEMALDRLADAT